MKIHKSPTHVSSVLEKCIKTLFSTQDGNFRSKFMSCQAYQDAANYVFEKGKDNCFRNNKVLRGFINNKGFIRNNIKANIHFYREVRVIPRKYYVQIYKYQ